LVKKDNVYFIIVQLKKSFYMKNLARAMALVADSLSLDNTVYLGKLAWAGHAQPV